MSIHWAVRVLGLIVLVTSAISYVFIHARSGLPAKTKIPPLNLHAFEEPAYFELVLGRALSFMRVYIVYYHIEGQVRLTGNDSTRLNSHYLVSLRNIGSIFGRVVPNYLADKYALSSLVRFIFWCRVPNNGQRNHPILIQGIFILIGDMVLFSYGILSSISVDLSI